MKNKLLALITVLAFLACNPGTILLPKGVAKTSTTTDQTSTTAEQTSTTAEQTSTTADLSSTTADLSSTTADLSSTTAEQTSTTADLSSTTADLSSTTADLSSTTADLSSTTADLSSTTADLSSTTADLSSTTADLSSTTADLSSTTTLIQTKEELITKLKETAKKIVDQVGKERANLNNIESPTQSGIKYKVFSSNSLYTDEDRRKFYSSLEYDEKRIRDFAKILNKISDYGAREYDLLVGSIVSMGYWTIQRLFEATYENIDEREHRLAQLKEEDIRTIESELENMHKIKAKWLETIDAIILSYEKNEDGISSNVKKLIDHLQTKYSKHGTFLPDEKAAMLKARSRIYDDFLHDLPLWELWKD